MRLRPLVVSVLVWCVFAGVGATAIRPSVDETRWTVERLSYHGGYADVVAINNSGQVAVSGVLGPIWDTPMRALLWEKRGLRAVGHLGGGGSGLPTN